CQQGYDIPYTF
nr:immunoglobulin light chain junction region [Macaca mulatta]